MQAQGGEATPKAAALQATPIGDSHSMAIARHSKRPKTQPRVNTHDM